MNATMARRRTASALLLVLAACAEPPVIEPTCPHELSSKPSSLNLPLAFTGEPYELEAIAPSRPCRYDAVRVTAEALETIGAPLVIGEPRLLDGADLAATISFTPRVAGLHLIRVVFEPELGARSYTLVVADTRPLAPIVETFDEPVNDCESMGRTSRGAFVCQRADGGATVFRQGRVESTFPATDVRVAGDVVWSVGFPGSLVRRTDTGTSLRVDGQLPGFAPTRRVLGEHGPNFAVRPLQSETFFTRVTWNGDARTPREPPRLDAEPWVQVSAGRETVFAAYEPGPAGSELFHVDRTDTLFGHFELWPLFLVRGFDRHAVWTSHDGLLEWIPRPLKRVLRPANQPTLRTSSMMLPVGLELMPKSFARDGINAAVPQFASDAGVLIPVLRDGDVVIEAWKVGGQPVLTSDDWIIAAEAPNRLAFHRR